jgi:hypothetical protein
MERLNKDPDERLERMLAGGAGKVTFQDPGPQYAASMAKLMQAIMQGRKIEDGRGADGKPKPQRIEVVLTDLDEPSE